MALYGLKKISLGMVLEVFPSHEIIPCFINTLGVGKSLYWCYTLVISSLWIEIMQRGEKLEKKLMSEFSMKF